MESFSIQDDAIFELSGLRVAVVGAGALGSEVCRQMAVAGLTRALVLDPDVLEARNLELSVLYRDLFDVHGSALLGQPKARLVADYVHSRYADRAWEARQDEIADVGFEELRQCDAILSCSDSTLARVEAARAVQALRLPMIDGGVMPSHLHEGRVSFFPGAGTSACYLCGLSEVRRADVLAYATSLSLSCAAIAEPSSMTGTPPAVASVARQMVRQLRSLVRTNFRGRATCPRAYTDRLRQTPGTGTQGEAQAIWERHILARSADCPWHEFEPPTELFAVQLGQTFREMLVARGGGEGQLVLELPWPICLRSRCAACGFADRPRRRVALVRRKGCCPRCGVRGKMEPLESLATIKAGDATAACTPQQLGLTEQHLYKLRRSVVFKGSGVST